MADETWAVAVAVGNQTALGTVNATIAALTGSIDSSDGCVLGDGESGDAESGITLPDFVRIARAVADVSGSFTAQASSFQRVDTQNLAITVQLKGNGELTDATPAVGEASILTATATEDQFDGIDALWQAAGLIGANGGAAVEYDYTPRVAASSPSTRYVTVMLWVGDLSFALMDCICESAVLEFTPGGTGLCTFNLRVGSVYAAADGVTFPTIDYGSQASLSAPIVQGVANAWSSTRGFRELTVTIDQGIEEIADSNQATGVRLVQGDRTFLLDGAIWVDDGDSDFDYANLSGSSAPTADLSFLVGTASTVEDDVNNAYRIECNNVEHQSVKYNREGTTMVVEFSGAKCTATAVGGEFTLAYA